MLESLKDLYISHPFLPVADAPEWFSHIKDIHCVVTFDAVANPQNKNGNYVRAWLIGLSASSATVRVQCKQLQNNYIDVVVPLVVWTGAISTSGNYALIDSDFVAPDSFSGQYELNPDVLVIMQKAPVLYLNGIKQPVGLEFKRGYNVSVSRVNDGVLLYGAAGAGEGTYKYDPTETLEDYQKGLGAHSVNGITESIRIDGTFPVSTEFRFITIDDLLTPNAEITLKLEASE